MGVFPLIKIRERAEHETKKKTLVVRYVGAVCFLNHAAKKTQER